MFQYDSFGTSIESLDNIARNMNKKQIYNNAVNTQNRFEQETLKGVEAYGNIFSAYDKNKSDFTSGLPTPMEDMDSISDIKDLSSEYSYLPKKKQKHLRLNNKHLKDYTDSDEQMILEHIKSCNECKNQLLILLKDNNHEASQKSNQSHQISPEVTSKINYKEIKEIIIIVMIGIIILFLLDVVLRK